MTGMSNLFHFVTDRGLIAKERLPHLAEAILTSYHLVHWNEPLHWAYGNGHFLVRRDISLDERVSVLQDRTLEQYLD